VERRSRAQVVRSRSSEARTEWSGVAARRSSVRDRAKLDCASRPKAGQRVGSSAPAWSRGLAPGRAPSSLRWSLETRSGRTASDRVERRSDRVERRSRAQVVRSRSSEARLRKPAKGRPASRIVGSRYKAGVQREGCWAPASFGGDKLADEPPLFCRHPIPAQHERGPRHRRRAQQVEQVLGHAPLESSPSASAIIDRDRAVSCSPFGVRRSRSCGSPMGMGVQDDSDAR
jgi:hypothetical protein